MAMAVISQLSQAVPLGQTLPYGALLCAGLTVVWPWLHNRLIQAPVDVARVCDSPQYTVRTLSFDPLIQHIENFITPREIQRLLDLARPEFSPSTTVFSNGTTTVNGFRTSSTAFLPKEDFISQCILARAAEYQGYVDLDWMEELQVTRYIRSQHFGSHYDWLQDERGPGDRTWDRETTFFASLEANCSSCGTHFPNLVYHWENEDPRWCRIVDCNEKDGLTVNPVVGSALFWTNLHPDGIGDRRMLHAGLPVPDGQKTGLNIWTTRPI